MKKTLPVFIIFLTIFLISCQTTKKVNETEKERMPEISQDWKIEEGLESANIFHKADIKDIYFSEDDEYFISVSDKDMIIWDAENYKPIQYLLFFK